jgi:LysM repeat protein
MPLAPTPTPGPLLYTVQGGDTLYSIAAAHGVSLEDLIAANTLTDPNLIRPGDILIIPGQTAAPDQPAPDTAPMATSPPRPTLPTPTPSGPPVVEIAGVLGAGSLETEVVRVRNTGGAASLANWTLTDASGTAFVFPRLVLFPGGQVAVYSHTGQSSPTALYWGRSEPAWNSGQLVVLRNDEGEAVDTYIVP